MYKRQDVNSYINTKKSRMVTLETILPLLEKGDWFAVIDPRDAYFHTTFSSDNQHFLHFARSEDIYEFKVLPFDLSMAPRVFTKCMALVGACFRLWAITVFPYMDDWLMVADSKSKAEKKTSHSVLVSMSTWKSHI